MTIQDIINFSSKGILKKLAVGKDPDSIVSYLNLGVIELYKRFPLKTEEVIIKLGVPNDSLDKYIALTENTYQMPDDYMRIIDAWEESGKPISINDGEDPLSIMTISYDTIQIPTNANNTRVSIIYGVNPSLLTSDDLSAKVPIPLQLLEPLLLYIGYAGNVSENGNIDGENNTHLMRFEASIKRINDLGLITREDTVANNRVFKRGFQ